MGRFLYRVLLHLHPRSFRERFGEEILGIYDEEPRDRLPAALLLDCAASLFRQWVLRPVSPEPVLASMGPAPPPGVPVFHTFETGLPRRGALFNGAILTIVSFALVTFALGHSRPRGPVLLIGAYHPRPNVAPVDRSSVAETEPTTRVEVQSPAVDALYEIAGDYFKSVRVLDALDADRNRIVSASEIATASSALGKLDQDSDGALGPEECGFFLGRNSWFQPDSVFVRRAQLVFMRVNPVLAALDTDTGGDISPGEIKKSSTALATLDSDWDGRLTPMELLPHAGRNIR